MSGMSKRVAYLKGLAEGLNVSGESGKLMLAMIDAMEAMADELEQTQEKLDELMEYVEEIDENVSDMEDALYADDDDDEDEDDEEDDEDDDDDDEGMIEYECPHCGTVIFFDEQAFDMEQEHICPNCQRPIFEDEPEDGDQDDGDED